MQCQVDSDHTGTITLEELIAYFDKAGIQHDDLAKTFKVLDVDKAIENRSVSVVASFTGPEKSWI